MGVFPEDLIRGSDELSITLVVIFVFVITFQITCNSVSFHSYLVEKINSLIVPSYQHGNVMRCSCKLPARKCNVLQLQVTGKSV